MVTVLGLALRIGPAEAGTNDYPAKWRDAPQDSVTDDWGYPNRECTSFVAWRLSTRNGYEMPRAIGDANRWDDYFRARGIRVDAVPAVGAIAQTDDGPQGHVAWVESVQDETVTLEDYNYDEDVGPDGQFVRGIYHERTVLTSRYRYIHVKDLSSSPTPKSTTTTTPPAVTSPPSGGAITTAPPAITTAPPAALTGLAVWGLDSAGFVSSAGNAPVLGGASNALGPVLAGGIDATALTGTSDGRGYWVVDARGTVYPFGSARPLGSIDRTRLGFTERAVALVRTPSAAGYWIVTSTGRVVAFGDAPMIGDASALPLNAPIVAAAGTPSGRGYVLVAADGGVLSFGDARFAGSMGSSHPNRPIVAAATTATGRGYWLAAADGEVFAFGDAEFHGSLGSQPPAPVITAFARNGEGYVIGAADGSVFDFTAGPYRRTSMATTPGHAIVALWVPAT